MELPDGPTLAHPPPPPSANVRAAALSPKKTRALRVLMLLVGGISLIAAAATVWEITRFNSLWASPAADQLAEANALADAEGVSAVALLMLAVVEVAMFVMLIVWMFAASRDVARTDAKGRKWRPAWAIAGWFLPLAGIATILVANRLVGIPVWLLVLTVLATTIASWVVVRSVLNEIDRVSAADSERQRIGTWRYGNILTEGRVWWAGLVIGGYIATGGYNAIEGQLDPSGVFDDSAYAAALWRVATGTGVVGITSLVGSRYIAKLGTRFG